MSIVTITPNRKSLVSMADDINTWDESAAIDMWNNGNAEDVLKQVLYQELQKDNQGNDQLRLDVKHCRRAFATLHHSDKAAAEDLFTHFVDSVYAYTDNDSGTDHGKAIQDILTTFTNAWKKLKTHKVFPEDLKKMHACANTLASSISDLWHHATARRKGENFIKSLKERKRMATTTFRNHSNTVGHDELPQVMKNAIQKIDAKMITLQQSLSKDTIDNNANSSHSLYRGIEQRAQALKGRIQMMHDDDKSRNLEHINELIREIPPQLDGFHTQLQVLKNQSVSQDNITVLEQTAENSQSIMQAFTKSLKSIGEQLTNLQRSLKEPPKDVKVPYETPVPPEAILIDIATYVQELMKISVITPRPKLPFHAKMWPQNGECDIVAQLQKLLLRADCAPVAIAARAAAGAAGAASAASAAGAMRGFGGAASAASAAASDGAASAAASDGGAAGAAGGAGAGAGAAGGAAGGLYRPTSNYFEEWFDGESDLEDVHSWDASALYDSVHNGGAFHTSTIRSRSADMYSLSNAYSTEDNEDDSMDSSALPAFSSYDYDEFSPSASRAESFPSLYATELDGTM